MKKMPSSPSPSTSYSLLQLAFLLATAYLLPTASSWSTASLSFVSHSHRCLGHSSHHPRENNPRPHHFLQQRQQPLWFSAATSSDKDYSNDYDNDDYDDLTFRKSALPLLEQWELLDDGSVAGIISNHPTFDNGSRIDTSVITTLGMLTYGTIVTTVSGSQYLLGHELGVTQLDQWEWTTTTCSSTEEEVPALQGKTYGHTSIPNGEWITTSAIVLDQEQEQALIQTGTIVTTASGSRYRLGEPAYLQYPHLEQWKRLEGGSIAGIVSRHDVIPNGELITTSPLVEYDESYGVVLVTTASGSKYQLGEREQPKRLQDDDDDADEQSNELKEQDDNSVSKDDEEIGTSIAIPQAPDMAPPAHVFESDQYGNDYTVKTPHAPVTPPKLDLDMDSETTNNPENASPHFFAYEKSPNHKNNKPKPPSTLPPPLEQEVMATIISTNNASTMAGDYNRTASWESTTVPS